MTCSYETGEVTGVGDWLAHNFAIASTASHHRRVRLRIARIDHPVCPPAIYGARMATIPLNATPMASKPTWDADCHVTLGRERPSGSICDSLAANGGGKYLPTTYNVS